MTAVQAPVAFRLTLAIELNLISAPMVEAVPIPQDADGNHRFD